MQSELLSGRRLRFDMEMDPRESIPGVIARGVREHVLVWTRPVLEAAGMKLTHIGHSQLASPAELERLAYVARCSDQALLANAGARVSPEGGGRTIDIRFGGHDVPLALIELNRRRIAPLSLRLRPHHRLDWMNLLLPYCPESLERLVGTCPACNSRLGWHYAKGIGHCEYCEGEVPPSLEGGLPDHLAQEYRLFAKLSSSVGAEVSEAMTAFPPDLRDMAPKNLVRLALMTGGMVQPEPVVTTSRKAVLVVPKPTLACVIGAGTAFLQSWPFGFQKWVAERRESTRHDPAAYRDLRNRLRRLISRNNEEDELTGLVHEAFPKLGLHPVHSLPTERRYYLYQQVQRKLGLEPRQMVRLRTHPEVRFTGLPSPCFQKGQFDAEHIDALEPIFRDSVAFNSCTGRLGLPLYAIEQCCRPRLLERERDPVFEAVKSTRSVTSASLAAFTMALKASRLRSRPLKHAVSLSVAAKQIGGRRKPWASILLALLDRRIDFWIVGAHPTPQSIRVRPSDLSVFLQVVDQPAQGVIHSAEVSQADAAEILNIRSDRIASIAEGIHIPFSRSGRALHAPMPAVLAAAQAIAWDMEISWHLGVRFHLVEDLLLSRRIPRRSTGWCRRRLIEEEILPPSPPLMEA